MSEAQLVHDIRLALSDAGDLVLWRNSVGAIRADHGQMIRYGLARGAADLIGLLAPSGRFIALEVKTARGHLSETQMWYLDLIRRFGGFAAVVRSADEAIAAIKRARDGELR